MPAAPEAAPETTPVRTPRAVYWFGATSLANDLASDMVYPLLPAFVTRTLGGGALALGLLDGVADAVAAAFKLVSGYLAERPRVRGPLVVAGYTIAALVRPFIAMAAAAWHVVALRAVDRVGKGVRTAPRDVMIADAVPGEHRGRAFGIHRGADHAGAVLGPLVAAGLLAAGLSVRGVFWMAVVPGVLAALLAAVAVRKAQAARAALPAHDGPADGISDRERAEGLAPLVAVLALAAALRAPETLVLLRVQDLGMAVSVVPLAWAALHVVRSLSSYPGGALADRWGPRRTLAIGWLLAGALAIGFARAGTVGQAWTLFLAHGLVAGLTESPERSLVSALTGGSRRGRGFGWYHGALSAVALPGAALFGWLYQVHGATSAFYLSAGATALATGLLAASGLRKA